MNKLPFMLTDSERNSALWAKLETHYQQRLEQLRKQNDGDQPENTTTSLRGRIAEVKAILSLGKEQIPQD